MIGLTVAGDPIHIADREIVPILRVRRVGRTTQRPPAGRAVMGGGLVRAEPVAVVERSGGRERRIVIPDVTGQAVRGIVTAGAVVWVVLWIVRGRWSHDR